MQNPELFSSGYLVFRRTGHLQFLLMQHANRWDLPKGHLDPSETKQEAALRELREETGIDSTAIWHDPNFAYVSQYWVTYKRKPKPLSQQAESGLTPHSDPDTKLKELTIYLAFMKEEVAIQPTEHLGFRWFDWNPPHNIQSQTIDPLLNQVQLYLANQRSWPTYQVPNS